jgi:hypothetical protein
MAEYSFIKMSESNLATLDHLSPLEKFFDDMKRELHNSAVKASSYFCYDFEKDRPLPDGKRFIWEVNPERNN